MLTKSLKFCERRLKASNGWIDENLEKTLLLKLIVHEEDIAVIENRKCFRDQVMIFKVKVKNLVSVSPRTGKVNA